LNQDYYIKNHLTDKENYYNIKKLSPSCLDNAIYNYNENPIPLEELRHSIKNKRLNAIHKALFYYILYVKDKK